MALSLRAMLRSHIYTSSRYYFQQLSGGKQARTLADAASSAAQVPLCARVAASLAPVFPDVSAQLVHILEDEFAALQVCWHTHQQLPPF